MIHVNPDALGALAKDLHDQVIPALDDSASILPQLGTVTHANFTSVTLQLATAYLLALEFTEEELRSKRDQLDTIRGKLEISAERWRECEQKSTPLSDYA